MKALQNVIYKKNPNSQEIKVAIDNVEDDESSSWPASVKINQELITAICLKYELFPILIPFITCKRAKYWELPHQDPLLLYKLYSYNLITLSEAKKFHFIEKYLQKVDGKEVPEDFDSQIEVHFGGPIATIIAQDDITSLQEISMRDNFSFDQTLAMNDGLFDYHDIPLIYYAAQKGALQCFKFLLINGATPVYSKSIGNCEWNCMAFAASSGSLEIIKILQEREVPILPDTVEAAAKFHQKVILNWLVDVHEFDFIKLNKALQICTQWNYIEGMEICLGAGADSTIVDNHQKNPLHYLAHFNNTEVLDLFFSKEVHVNDSDCNGETPLHDAARNNSILVAKKLIEYHAEINPPNTKGRTPIYYAACYNAIDIIDFLIDQGVDPNSQGKFGFTPLIGASKHGSKEAAIHLLDRGANLNCKDSFSQTPLHHAAKMDQKDFVEFLMDHGLEADSKDDRSKTPLHHACIHNAMNTAKFLIERGATINIQDDDGWTPLLYATDCQSKEIVEMLLNNGADPTIHNDHQDHPLIRAIVHRSEEIAQMLLSHGASVNKLGFRNRSPLFKAVNCEAYSIARQLISKGAKLGDDERTSIFEIAQSQAAPQEFIDYLAQHFKK